MAQRQYAQVISATQLDLYLESAIEEITKMRVMCLYENTTVNISVSETLTFSKNESLPE